MESLILHHYDLSPFSQKTRSMLGYAGLSWQSVITREMPPRPLLEALTGGYRKIPVAQIGADIFCDTQTISTEIARLSHQPQLALENCSSDIQDFAHNTDLRVFFACLTICSSRALFRKVRESLTLREIAQFTWDRLSLGRSATTSIIPPHKAKAYVMAHLAEIESRLEQHFIFGEQPNHADFSAFHSLWFLHDVAEHTLLQNFPRTLAWFNRMAAFGNGLSTALSAEEALQIALQTSPRVIAPEHRQDTLINQKVAIAPSDYGQTPTTGRLVGVTPSQWIVAREMANTGTLHIHFPRKGFQLTEL
jgi:glutathione S-transferase